MSEPMIWLVGKRDGVMRWGLSLNQDAGKFIANMIAVASSAQYSVEAIQDLHWEIEEQYVGILAERLSFQSLHYALELGSQRDGSIDVVHGLPVRYRSRPEGRSPEGREHGGIVIPDDETAVKAMLEVKAAEKSSHRTTHLLASYREIYTDTAVG